MRFQSNFVALASIACASLVSAATIRSTDSFLTDVTSALTAASSSSVSATREDSKTFFLKFSGTGTCHTARDASVRAEGYMTFKYLPDNTYGISACQEFCASVDGCMFANLYYEHNISLDGGATNLKCALYDQVHPASTKQNWGGQQQLPEPADLTFIRASTGWGVLSDETFTGKGEKAPENPVEITNFNLVFDHDGGIMTTPEPMAIYIFADYDTQGCADLCIMETPDEVNGECEYFNIVTLGMQDDSFAAHICILFPVTPDESGLEFLPEGDLFKLSSSRAYVLS